MAKFNPTAWDVAESNGAHMSGVRPDILRKDEYVLCFDSDTREGYLCRNLYDSDDYRQVNPLVEVLAMTNYPRQRAIITGLPNEIVPIAEGTVCRLHVLQRSTYDQALFLLRKGYKQTMHECLVRYYETTERLSKSPHRIEEREEYLGVLSILRRHLAGEFGEKRVVITK